MVDAISESGTLMGQTVVQEGNNIVSDMDGEKVMLSIANGKYYNLGIVGGRVWDLAKEPIAVADIIHSITDEFEVSASQCEADVTAFLKQLLDENLLKTIG